MDSIATIVLGDILLDTPTSNNQEFNILDENRFPHPDYNDFTQRNDIALIKLPQPSVYNDYVRPLCLNTIVEEETTFDTCFVAGWGFTMEDGKCPHQFDSFEFILCTSPYKLYSKSMCFV